MTKVQGEMKKVSFGKESYHFLQEQDEATVDKDAMWYDSDFIQSNIQRLSGSNEENNDDDLEACSCLTQECRRRRSNHMHSVLSMQSEIDAMGVQDMTGLRAFASALSKAEVKSAQERAARGAKEAFSVYESTQWLKGTTAHDFTRQTSVTSATRVKRKNDTENLRDAISESFRIVRAV